MVFYSSATASYEMKPTLRRQKTDNDSPFPFRNSVFKTDLDDYSQVAFIYYWKRRNSSKFESTCSI